MVSLHLNTFIQDPGADWRGETTSLAFAALAGSMNDTRKWTILDVGPPRAANVEFFSRFRCKLYIEDLQGSLGAGADQGKATIERWYAQLLPRLNRDKFDRVISWDILNYLDPTALNAFITQLRLIMHPDAHLHTLIFSQKNMPNRPLQFKIVAPDRLAYETSSDGMRPCPRYHQMDLKNMLRDFTVIKSVLLRNGMQEYLFKLKA